jgi:hypothetical protein
MFRLEFCANTKPRFSEGGVSYAPTIDENAGYIPQIRRRPGIVDGVVSFETVAQYVHREDIALYGAWLAVLSRKRVTFVAGPPVGSFEFDPTDDVPVPEEQTAEVLQRLSEVEGVGELTIGQIAMIGWLAAVFLAEDEWRWDVWEEGQDSPHYHSVEATG